MSDENTTIKPRRTRIREDAINLPNLLTFLRIALIPVVLWLISLGTPESAFWAVHVYGITAVTDYLDGWLARRQGLVSVLGKFLDPLADKLLVMSLLIFFVHLGTVPTWVVILMLGRELTITSLRVIAMTEGVVLEAGRGGKDKTAIQMVALMFLIVHHPYELHLGFGISFWANFNTVGIYLLYISLILAFTSGGEYVKLFVDAVEKKEERLRLEDEAAEES